MAEADPNADAAPDSELEAGGNYEVIRSRLREQGARLERQIDALNQRRREVFGGTELRVVANERARTENNCVPRDIVSVQGNLLFGYNVFVGLKTETSVADVFSLHRFAENAEGGFDLSSIPRDSGDAFLADPVFVKEFQELYRYYRDTRLLSLKKTDTRLLAIFQTGSSVYEVRVFRWKIQPDGKVVYMDSRGEEDNPPALPYDFEWTQTTREDQVSGRFPHLSILDEVFVETIGGDLTIKVEDNTETGQGVYAEPVEDPDQSLDDGQFYYAKLGGLILLKILPFREERWRYLVFNTKTQDVKRLDAIGLACRQLPEDHGIIFPGGYYLRSGTHKVFESDTTGLEIGSVVKSPNGEDVLYVFHRRDDGHYMLLPYNLIRKEAQSPIVCHGVSMFGDGRMVIFRALSDEPTRVHPMQVWQTPFVSAEYAAEAPTDGSYLAKVGNADLVRGISEAYTVKRLIDEERPKRQTYDDLVRVTNALSDAYYWLGHEEIGLAPILVEIRSTAELIIDEFEKVLSMRARAVSALTEAAKTQDELIRRLTTQRPSDIETFMSRLTELRHQRGHLISMREIRYVDLEALEALEARVVEQFGRVSRDCVEFLLRDDALAPLTRQLDELMERAPTIERGRDLKPLLERVEAVSGGLDVVSEIVAGLEVDDATARTRILEGISEVFAQLNRTRASMQVRRKELMSAEGRAEFTAQFNLLGQSVTSGLTLCDTPDKCDEQLSRLMIQLEELEARFSEFDEFLADIATKREEIYDAFSAKKQALLDARQRRADGLMSAANRILEGVARRARSFREQDDMNAYFASDAMVLKLRQIGAQLHELGDSVKADEVEARLLSARQDALRALRDKLELFEGGDDLIRLGRHRFSVNTQALELTMLPRDGGMALHLTGTDFYEPISDPEFDATRTFWEQEYVSESESVSRAEYLVASILFDAEAGRRGLSISTLHDAQRDEQGLLPLVRRYCAERYEEGYERGVHDSDAAVILERLLAVRDSAGLLRYAPTPRAIACLYAASSWYGATSPSSPATHGERPMTPPAALEITRGLTTHDPARRDDNYELRARSLGRLRTAFGAARAIGALGADLGEAIAAWCRSEGIAASEGDARLAGAYLAEELARHSGSAERVRFITSAEAQRLSELFLRRLELEGARRELDDDLQALRQHPKARLSLVSAWLTGFIEHSRDDEVRSLEPVLIEAAVILLTSDRLEREVSAALTSLSVGGLLSQHPRIRDQRLELRFDEFVERLGEFIGGRVPAFRAYREQRHQLLARNRERLKLDEFKPKVMSAFVRNKLINDVYLPLIGDNLAKQMGAAGESKRTDLMGLLLLISPPGYGKTTLMEYVANRLGLVFMKVNGPSLGHSVHSLDPEEAPNATARQEVEKVNLAFEMGNNVMLYLDDIQHTHPEFLQKFISLCDAQRRIEGVWRGRTRTYDMRGKKFCVVMAGNPYTESGEKFQIPDMLANRADTYNLGDILNGKEDVFALSYIENSLTSNPVLQPLAAREQSDVYKLVRIARGEQIPTTDLSHGYSSAEIAEIVAVLARLFRCRDVLLAVNRQYIQSASQADEYRTEPPFKLQGSYRNMNKLAEKVASAMNDEEVDRLIDDHYNGEAQTLTTGAEQNLLKLAELRGRMSEPQRTRWNEIRTEYRQQKAMGGAEDDPITRVTGTLGLLSKSLGSDLASLRSAVEANARPSEVGTEHALVAAFAPHLAALSDALERVSRPRIELKVEGPPATTSTAASEFESMIQQQFQSLLPLAQRANQDLEESKRLYDRVIELLELIRSVDERLKGS